jgi:hypothetical protein
MPVRSRHSWNAVLTTDAVARWTTGRAVRELKLDERTPVREVLAYSETDDNFQILGDDAMSSDVLRVMKERFREGKPLAAVLLVGDEGELAGIATPSDIPRLESCCHPG